MYYSTTQQGMRNFELVFRKLFYFLFFFPSFDIHSGGGGGQPLLVGAFKPTTRRGTAPPAVVLKRKWRGRGKAPPRWRVQTNDEEGDSPSCRCVEKEVEGEGESPSSLARSNRKQRGGGQPLPPLC